MPKPYLERIQDAGVVGAGGAGFPTHVKVNNEADIVIANGVECEPLLKTDQKIMENFAEEIIDGLYTILDICGADKGIICIKEKYHSAYKSLVKAIGKKQKVEIFMVDNYYPAGDEQQLVYEVTGKVIPTGGLPIDVGAIVNNVSTIVNLSRAINDETPVTNRYVTVVGEVKNPMVLNVPIGSSIQLLIELAGGVRKDGDYKVILGGAAMGDVVDDWQTPITKIDGGIIVLPENHFLIKKKTLSLKTNYKISKSVCCQCNFCTQLCPRNALGLNVEPHKIMRAINYDNPEAINDPNSVISCCDCGLCTYYACDMGLSPHRIMTELKNSLLQKKFKPQKRVPDDVNEFRDFQKVPTDRFVQRLGISNYVSEVTYKPEEIKVDNVKIPLKQHVGISAFPVVEIGDKVEKGELIGKVGAEDLGAYIHTSISGIVSSVTDKYIEIRKNS